MEAHAKKQDMSAGARDLAPRGSAALLGWPEFGFGLYPEGDKQTGETLKSRIVRWRGDRDQGRDWPTELQKGGPFPWTADNVAPEVRRQIYLPGDI
jgi:replicative DNA helicase